MIKKEELKLVSEWDKTFKKSDKVEHSKVTFVNRYGITLAADMYVPKDAAGKLPAIAVSGPFGAVKEQWRKCQIYGLSRYQYGRFYGGGGFPVIK